MAKKVKLTAAQIKANAEALLKASAIENDVGNSIAAQMDKHNDAKRWVDADKKMKASRAAQAAKAAEVDRLIEAARANQAAQATQASVVEAAPKQGFISRMRGAVAGAEEGAVAKAAGAIKAVGGLKGAAKTLGGGALVALPAALELADVAKVASDPNSSGGDVVRQATGGTMRTLGGMGGAVKGAQYGASIVPGHPLAKLAGGVIGGTLGYVGSNLLADKLVGNPAADLAKENAEDAALKAATEGRKKKLAIPAYQHKIAMDALDKEYREALKNGQDPSEILQRARALKQGSLGIQGALDAEDAKKAGAGNQGHPLAALFQQAMANLQPPQLKQVTYKPQGAWEPMQHVVEGVENARTMANYERGLGASQKLMDQAIHLHGTDMQAQTARSKLAYDAQQAAAERGMKMAEMSGTQLNPKTGMWEKNPEMVSNLVREMSQNGAFGVANPSEQARVIQDAATADRVRQAVNDVASAGRTTDERPGFRPGVRQTQASDILPGGAGWGGWLPGRPNQVVTRVNPADPTGQRDQAIAIHNFPDATTAAFALEQAQKNGIPRRPLAGG